ncbi:MAG: DUF4340 domain-containing protein [Opitutales bacterium]
MKTKQLIILNGVLAVLIVLALWLKTRPAAQLMESGLPAGTPIVTDSTLSKADGLDLGTADEPAAVRIRKTGTDGDWVLPDYFGLPVDIDKLQRLVRALGEGQVIRTVTRNPERMAALGLGEERITLVDAAGEPVWGIALGRPSENDGIFARIDNNPFAVLADLNVFIDPDLDSWVRKDLIPTEAADIRKVTVTPLDGSAPLTFSRADPETPFTLADASMLAEGESVKADAVTRLARNVLNARITEARPPDAPVAAAAAPHLHTVNLTTFEEETLTVRIGRDPGEPAKTPLWEAEETDTPADPASLTETEEPVPGPVVMTFASSDPDSPLNHLATRATFIVGDFVFNQLPADRSALIEPQPEPETGAEAAPEAELEAPAPEAPTEPEP